MKVQQYTWGDIFTTPRSNTGERGKAAVGLFRYYPSPYHVYDMATNVREWTHTLYRLYPYTLSDGREVDESDERRVLRGDTYATAKSARAASRGYGTPDYTSSTVGFRLALSAARSE